MFMVSFNKFSDAQNNKYYHFNGWEFLEWSWDKDKVENKLSEQGISFDAGSPNQIQGATTKFTYNKMLTRLAYDFHLYDIQQYKYFQKNEKKQAKLFFNNLKLDFIKKYGEPISEKHNIKENKIIIIWHSCCSRIRLEYSYNNLVIKNLDDRTFSIYIHTNELDNE